MKKRPTENTLRPATRRNLPAVERRHELLESALDLFAEKGNGITVQELADRVKVTQPLVHRYFPVKADLIEAIRDSLQYAHWDPLWKEILTDRGRPLGDRIIDFYDRYLPHIYGERWYRGFLFAALDNAGFAQDYLAHVHDELHIAIMNECRHHCGYPDLAEVPPFEREIELVWGMHSSLVFVGIRRYVYHTAVSADIGMIVGDQVRAFLKMAPEVMADLMATDGNATPAQSYG